MIKRYGVKISAALVLVMVMVLMFTMTVQAAPPKDSVVPADLFSWFVDLVLVQWTALVGVAALITAVVNILKQVGIVKDSTAMTWSAGLNLIGMAVLIILKLFQPGLTVEFMDERAGTIAQLLIILSGFALQLISGYLVHKSIQGIPFIGKSFSLEAKHVNPDPVNVLEP